MTFLVRYACVYIWMDNMGIKVGVSGHASTLTQPKATLVFHPEKELKRHADLKQVCHVSHVTDLCLACQCLLISTELNCGDGARLKIGGSPK